MPLVGLVDGEDVCVPTELADPFVDAGGDVAGELTHGGLVDYKPVLGEADCRCFVEVGDTGFFAVWWTGWWVREGRGNGKRRALESGEG